MGGGASTEMSLEEQLQIAGKCTSELLRLASTTAVEAGKNPETWGKEELKIPVPMYEKFASAQEAVAKIPMVGGKLAGQVGSATESISQAFVDCAVTVCQAPGTLETFNGVITGMAFTGTAGMSPIEMCRKGGDAFADYLVFSASKELEKTFTPVVAEVLKTHTLTKVWDNAIGIYGTVASKIPALKPIELNLTDYCVRQILRTLEVLIRSKEREVRQNPETAEGATETMKMVFKGGQPAPKADPRLILVSKGDPRSCVFANAAAFGESEPQKLTVKNMPQGAVLLKFTEPRANGTEQYLELVVGKDGEQTVSVTRKAGAFLSVGDKSFGVCQNRFFVGSPLNLISDSRGEEHTFNLARTFNVNEDGTISPALNICSGFVIGFEFAPDIVSVGALKKTE
jgi:hypothetical protein